MIIKNRISMINNIKCLCFVSEVKILSYYVLLHVTILLCFYIMIFVHMFKIIDKFYNIINRHLNLISYDGKY